VELTVATAEFEDEKRTPETIGAVVPSDNVPITLRACEAPFALRLIEAGDKLMAVTDCTETDAVAWAVFPAPSVAKASKRCCPLPRNVVSRLV
jgi:hypothetical protein